MTETSMRPPEDRATQTMPPVGHESLESLTAHQPAKPLKLHGFTKPLEILQPTKSIKEVWDFRLPELPKPSVLKAQLDQSRVPAGLILAAKIQHGECPRAIQEFLNQFPEDGVRETINYSVQGFGFLFYASQANNDEVVRLLAGYGADVNSMSENHNIPLLAFVVMNSQIVKRDATSLLGTLLSLGATAEVFPKAFYSPYSVDLPVGGPPTEEMSDLMDDKKKWCRPASIRSKLALALNLTQRYYLEKSTKIPKPWAREQQVAEIRKMEAVLGIPYLIIGQTPAAQALRQSLRMHMARNKGKQNRKPLVLVFAGPSGHGKTELATKLGELLSMTLENVNCPAFSTDTGLFGPRPGYVDAQKGSKLNNFLSQHNGKKCIVFLDEFEKTSKEVHNTLLKPFDEGLYQNRANNTDVDASQVIWVLATNAADNQIMNFCDLHSAEIFDEQDLSNRPRLVKELSHVIKNVFKEKFGAPITGRVSAFVPFLPFSKSEQVVGVHKCLLEFAKELREPVNLSGENERLIGNVLLNIRNDVAICQHIVEEGYDRDLGIRSLKVAVAAEVEGLVIEKYLSTNIKIAEDNPQTEYFLDLRKKTLVVTEREEPEEEL